MTTLRAKIPNTMTLRRAGQLAASSAVAGSLLLPGMAAASSDQVCSGRSIRFVSGQTASSDTLRFGQTLPAGVYDAMLVTADSYPERASSDGAGQQTEIVEVVGIVSSDLADGVEMTNDITYGRFTASMPFSSVTAYHRASTPGPNSVWVSTFCVTLVETPPVATTVPMTAPPTTVAPSTTVPTTPVPTTPVPTTVGPTSSIAPPTTADGSLLGPSTTVGPVTTVATPESTILDPVESTVPARFDSGDPFGVSEPIPAGPIVPDANQPFGTPQPLREPGTVPTRADVPTQGTLPLTGTGLGVALVALALLGAGLVTSAGAKSLDAAGNAE